MKIKKCINCGYCCKVAACAFGVYDSQLKACEYLKEIKPGLYSCDQFQEILKNPLSKFNPAFGAGCCSSINSYRQDIKLKYYEGIEQYL